MLDVDRNTSVAHLAEDTTSVPGVKLSIAENNVGGLHEIIVGSVATKVSQSPVVLRLLREAGLTNSSVLLLVPL